MTLVACTIRALPCDGATYLTILEGEGGATERLFFSPLLPLFALGLDFVLVFPILPVKVVTELDRSERDSSACPDEKLCQLALSEPIEAFEFEANDRTRSLSERLFDGESCLVSICSVSGCSSCS